jgi:hypothetical protein
VARRRGLPFYISRVGPYRGDMFSTKERERERLAPSDCHGGSSVGSCIVVLLVRSIVLLVCHMASCS